MEKVLGIIAEYNPFHNGHLHHLNESKKIANCKYSVCVMGGNFTQRGSCSLVDKWSKAKMAILNGVDLVIELPVLYSVSSAENFAYGAVKILDSLNVVTDISFGAESNRIDLLDAVADVLTFEPIEFKNLLTDFLDSGVSFPKARECACLKYFEQQNISFDCSLLKDVLSSPNNILGIEYLKALKKIDSKIVPHVVNRVCSDYNSVDFKDNIASSTAIRNIVSNNENLDVLKTLMPDSSFSVFMNDFNCGHVVTGLSCFEKEIFYTLRKLSVSDIANLADVREGLEFKIKRACGSCNSLDSFFDVVKSKRFTRTCLQRILLYSLLGITNDVMALSKNVTPYVRVLGFNDNGKHLLSDISKCCPDLPIITSVKRFVDSCSDYGLNVLLDKDILASDIYSLAYSKDSFANLDYTTPLFVFKG